MKALILFSLLALSFSKGFSQCDIDPYIQQNYITDAWIMVFRNFVENPAHPDYNIPILNPDKTIPYLEKLSAVYEISGTNPVADSLFNKFNMHVNDYFPARVAFSEMILYVPEEVWWTYDFINTGISGEPALDQLMEDYQFTITQVGIAEPPPIYIITIKSEIEYLNVYALLDDFNAIDGMDLSEAGFPKNPYNYTGIHYLIDNEEVRSSNIVAYNDILKFSLHTGDCFFGCPDSKAWEAQISEDCSQVNLNLLGITDVSQIIFSVYPNPASDKLYFIGNSSEITSLHIYSIQGKLIQSLDNISKEIDVSQLTAGMYFIEIKTSGGIKNIQKFIKI